MQTFFAVSVHLWASSDVLQTLYLIRQADAKSIFDPISNI